MPTEDKRRGKSLPSPVVPSDTVCFTIQVPNAVQYRAAFLQQISILGEWQTWDHPIDGTVCEDCETAAQLWRNALYYAVWSDECGGDMSCANVADCIENDPTTRTVIQNIVNNVALPQVIATQGQPMTIAQANTPLNPIPDGCNKDAFWAQCQQFTEFFTQAGSDFIQKIEVYTNGIEGAAFIEMAPVLGTIVDEVQLDKFIEFLDWAIETIGEFYEGALTQTVKDEIACAYFCEGKDDCTLTIERIWQVQNNRLGGLLVPSEITSIVDLINAFVAIGSNPALAVDIWLALMAGLAKFAGYMGVRGIDQTLALTLKLAINDANNDWEILCEDCAQENPNISFIGTFAPSYDGSPQTFIGNTPTGGSIWDLTFQNISGTIAVAVTAVNAASNPICVLVASTTNVVSYQHNLCAGGAQTGTIENPTTEYGPNLGWFGASGGSVMRVTVEPV